MRGARRSRSFLLLALGVLASCAQDPAVPHSAPAPDLPSTALSFRDRLLRDRRALPDRATASGQRTWVRFVAECLRNPARTPGDRHACAASLLEPKLALAQAPHPTRLEIVRILHPLLAGMSPEQTSSSISVSRALQALALEAVVSLRLEPVLPRSTKESIARSPLTDEMLDRTFRGTGSLRARIGGVP